MADIIYMSILYPYPFDNFVDAAKAPLPPLIATEAQVRSKDLGKYLIMVTIEDPFPLLHSSPEP